MTKRNFASFVMGFCIVSAMVNLYQGRFDGFAFSLLAAGVVYYVVARYVSK